MEGWLNKKGFLGRWSKLYFRLHAFEVRKRRETVRHGGRVCTAAAAHAALLSLCVCSVCRS
jgi:hypothetical protein